ncbi:MAG TPA: class I SAM-dependent methyltransferase [Streptosporangiaceae bacterium]
MMPEDYRREHAVSFALAAGAYERGRPPYPAEAIDWLLPDGAQRVLDLGAGTGKLTRLLLGRGLTVTAVEPLAEMREQLRRAVPGVPALAGTAEQIPLPDASADAVLVAQAWHWVDLPAAVPEVARVLSPGGCLGLLWNVRDEREEWVARLGEITRRREGAHASSRRISEAPVVGPPFGPVERRDVAWVHHLTPAGLTDMIASRSYVITLPAPVREQMFAEVDDLLRTHPALAGVSEIALPYVTRCSRARLGG